jgi:acid stress-induced BolA-like protein IbaG/YrbA
MAATSKKQLEKILTDRLGLEDPGFLLEKLPGGKLSGSIISDTFRGSDNIARQRKIWNALNEEFGAGSRDIVGTLLAYTKAEWYVPLEGDPSHVKKQRKAK